MVECRFNFMINSQVLWGDYDTVPGLAIYQLLLKHYHEQPEKLRASLLALLRAIPGLPVLKAGEDGFSHELLAVFAVLAKAWPDAAIVCGNGQIRLATLVLLDLFDGDTKFYYAGDYDPEDLLIAQRLRERYGERLRLWQYRREFYDRYRSDVEISHRSLKKLDRVHCDELQEIKQAMELRRKAAYQESMIGEYLNEQTQG